MNTVTVTRLINSDIDAVWSQIADVTRISNWHPAVATVDLLSAEPLTNFESEWRAEETTSGATQVTITMNYEMRFGVLGKAMNLVLVKGRMAERLGQVLAGLEHHVESGEIVGQEAVASAT